MKQALALLLLVCALGARAQYVPKSDWEEAQDKLNWKEGAAKLPAWPKRENLIEFFVTSASSFRFYIDSESLEVGTDGVVRYTLVARSPAGVENITYEGIRCTENQVKIFAIGNDARWRVLDQDWKRIDERTVQRWHNTLRSDIFCPARAIIASRDEGLAALRRGFHPALGVDRR